MDEWLQLTKNKCFISDLGESQSVEINGEKKVLGRYAVWSPVLEADGHQIIEVGDSVSALIEKYQIPHELVLTLERK